MLAALIVVGVVIGLVVVYYYTDIHEFVNGNAVRRLTLVGRGQG